MRNVFILLVCALAVSCTRSSYYNMDTWARPYKPSAAQSADSDDDIREAVFRNEMAHNATLE